MITADQRGRYITLHLPALAYAVMDGEVVTGEVLTLRIYMDQIQGLQFPTLVNYNLKMPSELLDRGLRREDIEHDIEQEVGRAIVAATIRRLITVEVP